MNGIVLGFFKSMMPSKSCMANLFVMVFVTVSLEVNGIVGKLK